MEKKDQPEQTPPRPDTPEKAPTAAAKEIGGRNGPEPTRYGDWENKGICSDF